MVHATTLTQTLQFKLAISPIVCFLSVSSYSSFSTFQTTSLELTILGEGFAYVTFFFVFFILLLLLLVSQLHLWAHHFWLDFCVCDLFIFNPAMVVIFHLRGWCMLGVFLLLALALRAADLTLIPVFSMDLSPVPVTSVTCTLVVMCLPCQQQGVVQTVLDMSTLPAARCCTDSARYVYLASCKALYRQC